MDNKEFDKLCGKIASGNASQEEIKKAFESMNEDIDNFGKKVKDQLEDLNK